MNIKIARIALIISCTFLTAQLAKASDDAKWYHAATFDGEPKYEEGFSHFEYVNPDAPKGGTLRLSETDSFDTLNVIPSKGELATGMGLVYETLLTPSSDEISTDYGLLAEAFSYPDDYSSVTYRLRENARWHDGQPVTPEDVIFSFENLIKLGTAVGFEYQSPPPP